MKNKKNLLGILAGAVVIIAISVVFSYQTNRELDSLNVYRKIDAVQHSETADWQTYKSDSANFTFAYPPTWEIREDYLYETPAGEKANNPTIVLCDKKVEKGNIENCIQINMRQAPFNARTKIIRENYLNLYTDDPEIVSIYGKVADSFFVFDNVPLKEIIVDQDRKNEEIEIGYGIKYELMIDETNKNKGIVRFYGAGDP